MKWQIWQHWAGAGRTLKNPHLGGPIRNWHAVLCKPRQDAVAEENLLQQGFETFRPKTQNRRLRNGRRWMLVQSMFPRYLFVRLSRQGQDWGTIRSTRGAVGLVRLGAETPIIPDPVIHALRQRCDDEGVIKLTGMIDYQPNDLVEIIDGACAGYRALFQARSGEERVVVLLKLLQHERSVEMAESAIRKA
jgi:transcriptional antiterminator RfaH